MSSQIHLEKVCVHNLKSVNLSLKVNQLIVFTGISGSGKSSMAFDTIYAEGQRRYVESLSTFARRQMDELSKPDLEHASGLSPTISIEQKTAGRNPRSTVGTMTEIYDYLRVLYARVGTPHCPVSGEPVSPQSKERIIKSIQNYPTKKRILILAPYARAKKAEFREDFVDMLRKGYTRARVDGKMIDLNENVALDGNLAHDVDILIDRLVIEPDSSSRIADSILQALNIGNGVCIILDADTEEETLYSTHAYSPKSGLSYESLEPQDFSFNSASGMCPRCHGLGSIQEYILDLIIDPELSIAEDCCSIGSSYQTVRYGNIYNNLARIYGFNVKTPWKKLSEKAKHVFLYGTEKKWTRMQFVHPVTGAYWNDLVQWRGVLQEAHSRYAEAKSDLYRKKSEKLMRLQTCPECGGSRLKPYPSATLLGGKKIHEISEMTISDAKAFFDKLKLTKQEALIAEELLKEIKERLQFMLEVGLHYLTLGRTSPTLSGGESQRVRLASQIGSGLVGITYILDEPSIGLHPRDNQKLIKTLKHLRDQGNTVIVVEHDEETILEADHVVDFGPGAGIRGGEIIVNGDLDDLLRNDQSITAAYLTGKKSIPVPKKRRKSNGLSLEISGATHHNLKNVEVKIPLGLFVSVTGVSGSGKSSLIAEILYPALSNALHGGDHMVGAHKAIKGIENIDKVIAIDQSPIGRNPRSNPSTYVKIFDEIRDLFCQLPESQARGYKPGRFSFNVQEGSCTQCKGMGMVKVDMDFMEEAWVECSLCKMRRFDEETLSILYKEKNIHDVLEMSIEEASLFFENIPSIHHKLQILKRVGLDYLKLGQPSPTLSGGEAQRIKLAKELVRPSTGKTLYILDEPTTGLHFHDIAHLLNVLHTLVEKGNSVLVIEHNMDVVKTSDWIIDLGPEGGEGGGEIVASGKPEVIGKMATPTGHALRTFLHHDFEKRTEELLHQTKSKKKKKKEEPIKVISVQDAQQNNLKNISVEIPRGAITVCTGPSGSGKSSLAFETIYAEGQRRYSESLSAYARQFVKQMPKPKVGKVEGLSPAIAIEQKNHAGNPRSTVGTMTEIYDYLRVLYARIGIAHSPETGEVIQAISKELVTQRILSYPPEEKLHLLAPLDTSKITKFDETLARLKRQGFLRIRLNGEFYHLDQETIPYDRKRKNELYLVIDRFKSDPSLKSRIYEGIEHATNIGNGKMVVLRDEKEVHFNLSFAVESTGKSYPEITPHTFAFNVQEGMCFDCQGLGYQYGANLVQNQEIMSQSLMSLMRTLWGDHYSQKAFQFVLKITNLVKIDPYTPLNELTNKQLQFLLQGSPTEEWVETSDKLQLRWVGINTVLAKAAKSAHGPIKQAVIPLMEEQTCISCEGARINPLARHVTINKTAIHEVCRMPIHQALHFIQTIKTTPENRKLLKEVFEQLINRLTFLTEIGLHYLALERRAPSLSGGEAQRIRLAQQLGSGLTGVLYVLDEPTIGLHPFDNDRLNHILQKLKNLGNTLILVEHDPLTIQQADYIFDFGPKAGKHGGYIVAQGTYKQILKNPKSLTGEYLSGRRTISQPTKRRELNKGFLQIKDAKKHNLKNIDVKIPINTLTCITGVSGSGKSTLIQQILLPAIQKHSFAQDIITDEEATIIGIQHFNKVISIDQNPLGHTVRSDVCTYVDLLTKMREFFATLPTARAHGLQPKHFSYNHRRGMCTACWGLGYKKVEMQFLPPVKVECSECHGLRLNPLSLEVLYKGKNLGEYLRYTVDEAKIVFQDHPKIIRVLDLLISVGLGYLALGQEIVSLSGGEAQRIKLSRELTSRSTGKTLYLLDEPTRGLHSDDIQKLIDVLQRLVNKGNTMVIIEHQIDLIKNADYIIDLGPEAGEKGGYVIATGTPEEIKANKKSITGKYL